MMWLIAIVNSNTTEVEVKRRRKRHNEVEVKEDVIVEVARRHIEVDM